MSRNGYLKTARIFAERSQQEFRTARATQDDPGIRQAAEKGWGAVFQATKALLEKRNLKPGRGTTRVERTLAALERRDRAIARLEIVDRFGYFLRLLHVDCFGEGDYSVEIVERALNKLTDYIRKIESA